TRAISAPGWLERWSDDALEGEEQEDDDAENNREFDHQADEPEIFAVARVKIEQRRYADGCEREKEKQPDEKHDRADAKASGRRQLPALKRRGNVVLGLEGGELERIGTVEQRTRQRIVERMARLECGVLPDQRVPEQVEVADRVQYLVLDELVVVAQSFGIEHAEVVQHDRVLQAATEPEARRAHRFDVVHEAKCPGARHFLDIGMLGEVDDDL